MHSLNILYDSLLTLIGFLILNWLDILFYFIFTIIIVIYFGGILEKLVKSQKISTLKKIACILYIRMINKL